MDVFFEPPTLAAMAQAVEHLLSQEIAALPEEEAQKLMEQNATPSTLQISQGAV